MEYFRISVILILGYIIGVDGCLDNSTSCSYWASKKECFTNTGYVPCTCPVSCAVNTTCAGNVTGDQSCKCFSYGSSGYCESDPALYYNICSTTCAKRANITCPNNIPEVIPHGTVENSSLNSDGIYRFLHRVKYNCDYGYDHGNYLRPSYMCDETGVWYWGYFNGNLSCKLINCSTPPNVNYTTVTYLNTTFEEQAIYSCQPGYSKVGGSEVKVCNLSNMWMGNDLICTGVIWVGECTDWPYFICAPIKRMIVPLGHFHFLDFKEDIPLQAIKNFVPKVREAEGAVAFGVLGIIVIAAVIGGICALDMTSCNRHYALFRRNTRPFRKWVKRHFKKNHITVENVSELQDFPTASVTSTGKGSMHGDPEIHKEPQHGINNNPVPKRREQNISNRQKKKEIFDVTNNPIQIEISSTASMGIDKSPSAKGKDIEKPTKKIQSTNPKYQKGRETQVTEGKSSVSTS